MWAKENQGIMSIHKSLKVKGKQARARNVLSREERLARLKTQDRWSEGRSVFGLPKVRVETVAPRKRAKEEKAAKAPETAPALAPTEAEQKPVEKQ